MKFKKENSNNAALGITGETLPSLMVFDRKYKFKEEKITPEIVSEFIEKFEKGESKPIIKSAKPIPEKDQKNHKVMVREEFQGYVDSGKDILLTFHSPSCIHCERLKPTLEKLAEKANSKASDKLVIASMDMNENDMPEFEIEYFPTIFLIRGKTHERIKYDKPSRTMEDLIKFVKQGDHAIDLSSDESIKSGDLKSGDATQKKADSPKDTVPKNEK